MGEAEKFNFIPSAVYYSGLLESTIHKRARYSENMFNHFAQADIIFFDPDNGFEVLSVKLGSKNSPKYLFWNELYGAFAKKHFVLVYHFPRKKRSIFVHQKSAQIREQTGIDDVYCFHTATVAFFLALQPRHRKIGRKLTEKVRKTWKGQILLEIIGKIS